MIVEVTMQPQFDPDYLKGKPHLHIVSDGRPYTTSVKVVNCEGGELNILVKEISWKLSAMSEPELVLTIPARYVSADLKALMHHAHVTIEVIERVPMETKDESHLQSTDKTRKP